ncbi:MAG: amino acid ABC transporter permease [Holophaga sp.]|nr:amino acid ABC transporter permease [Holophaga sp.]
MFHTLPLLAGAACATLLISLVSLVFAFILGVLVCAMGFSRPAMLRGWAIAHVHFFRGVPLLVQLLLLYYLLPSLGINLSSLAAAIIAVSLCSSAYVAEILRGGFLGIPPGQLEAAHMVGLSGLDTLRRIQVPQALRLTLPALVNEMILVIKASSLVSAVGVAELTRTAQNIAASTYKPMEIYFLVGVVYFLMNILLARLGVLGERRLAKAHQR